MQVVQQIVLMKTNDLRFHPHNVKTFGRPKPATYASVRHSVREHGVLEPLDVVGATAPHNPLCVVNGNLRLEIARELGIEQVPVILHNELSTDTDQLIFSVEGAKRKQWDQRQRAVQEQLVRAAIAAAPDAWKIAHNARRENDVIAQATGESVNAVKERKKVFYGKTSTDSLKDAVVRNRIRIGEAVKLIVSVEEEHAPGSEEARRAVDEAVNAAKRAGRRKRRGPKFPSFDRGEPAKAAPNFWGGLKQQVVEWALKQSDRRMNGLGEMVVHLIISDCAADVKAAVEEMKRKVERELKRPSHQQSFDPKDRHQRINRLLGELGMPPVRRGQAVDLREIKKAHKRIARQYHPDFTVNDPVRTKQFIEKQAVYKELMSLVEAHADTSTRAACA
jgi:hypothetical protein